jgi:hypothetical protein
MEIPPPQYPSFPFIPLIPKQALSENNMGTGLRYLFLGEKHRANWSFQTKIGVCLEEHLQETFF